MPYSITMEPTFVRIVLHGALTPQDLHTLADALAAIDKQPAVAPPRLIDLSAVTAPYLTYADVQAYAVRRQARPLANAVQLAIVAARPIQLGFARMYQNLNTHPQITIEIFATVEAALPPMPSPACRAGARRSAGRMRAQKLAQRVRHAKACINLGETWCYVEKPSGLIARPVAAAPTRTSNLHRRCCGAKPWAAQSRSQMIVRPF